MSVRVGSASRAETAPERCAPVVSIGRGTMDDYERLAHHHYKSGPPATIAKRADGSPCILSARDQAGRLAGVLVVSLPVLNSSWRRLAWPGEYESRDRRRDARLVNATLRCVSRAIVDPRFRGLGVARRLVRAYLDEPLTIRTEAVAAMGRVCPFLEAAGMTAYALPPNPRDARLLDALAAAGIEAWELLVRETAVGALARHGWLAREARVWARDSIGTRRFVDGEPGELLMLAASRAAHRPIAYAYGG